MSIFYEIEFAKYILPYRAITMDQSYFNTIEETRKSGRHLSLEERGMTQALHRKGYSLCSIASEHGRCI